MSVIGETTKTVAQQRNEAIKKLRRERYEWAKRVDPKAVEAFEANLASKLTRPKHR